MLLTALAVLVILLPSIVTSGAAFRRSLILGFAVALLLGAGHAAFWAWALQQNFKSDDLDNAWWYFAAAFYVPLLTWLAFSFWKPEKDDD